jgi:uncharacterized repeat protein (TIGR03837 family)
MKTWDIFCRVIDNYGDIGICWRLARQLATEHHQCVRLWVDELDPLMRIWPAAQDSDRQELAGVEVRRWSAEFDPDIQVSDVVIEAFACDIPPVYLEAMAKRKARGEMPAWINLEYLSAESWVEDCHRLPSTHAATGLRKTFFFPGFNSRTGGLLREQSLLDERDKFEARQWLEQLGVNPQAGALLISLFAYENPAIAGLLNAWADALSPVHCLVPAGKILTSINESLGQNLAAGDVYRKGNLCLQVIPFITQPEYDYLLWACDINFVRGEDSFVRAQWAGKPFVWHIYPQDEDTHITKLTAFIDKYAANSTNSLPTIAVRNLWLAWNGNGAICASWQVAFSHLNEWQQHSRAWCDMLVQQPDLTSKLVDFCANQQA